MYTITKRFRFSASHQLTKVPEGHKCARLHGHNYEYEIVASSRVLDAQGMVVDYACFDSVEDWVNVNWDHRHLNDVMTEEPTAEVLAAELYHIVVSWGLPQVVAVRVSETPDTWAEYRPERTAPHTHG